MVAESIHRRVSFVLLAIVLGEMLIALFQQHWATAALTLGIAVIISIPLVIVPRLHVFIPPQFQLLTIAIVFAALFLGEVRDYYTRFAWWDTALHGVTGFLMGMVGFLIVYMFNEVEHIGLRMKASFVAFFAFMFALGAGAIWEVAEFILDQTLGMNLQKPMLDDPSGLTDTMYDLMVDALGALVICVYGYLHLKRPHKGFFLRRWIGSFISNNPRLLRYTRRARQQRDA